MINTRRYSMLAKKAAYAPLGSASCGFHASEYPVTGNLALRQGFNFRRVICFAGPICSG